MADAERERQESPDTLAPPRTRLTKRRWLQQDQMRIHEAFAAQNQANLDRTAAAGCGESQEGLAQDKPQIQAYVY